MISLKISDEDAVTLCDILAESTFPAMSAETDFARELYCIIFDTLEKGIVGGGDPMNLSSDDSCCGNCGKNLN